MNLNTVFKILSFILMPIAILLGIFDIVALSGAISNPGMLLPVFIIATIVMYIFSSFRFLRTGINREKTFPKKNKDFIKVNGFVALGFSILSLFQAMTVLISKSAFLQLLDTYKKMAESYGISNDKTNTIIYLSLSISLTFSLIMITHILICFRLLKKYEDKFVD